MKYRQVSQHLKIDSTFILSIKDLGDHDISNDVIKNIARLQDYLDSLQFYIQYLNFSKSVIVYNYFLVQCIQIKILFQVFLIKRNCSIINSFP